MTPQAILIDLAGVLVAMARNRYFKETDGLQDGIGGAQAAGIAGLLVRTGKYRPSDVTNPEIRPACIADDFAQAVEAILAVNRDSNAKTKPC